MSSCKVAEEQWAPNWPLMSCNSSPGGPSRGWIRQDHVALAALRSQGWHMTPTPRISPSLPRPLSFPYDFSFQDAGPRDEPGRAWSLNISNVLNFPGTRFVRRASCTESVPTSALSMFHDKGVHQGWGPTSPTRHPEPQAPSLQPFS